MRSRSIIAAFIAVSLICAPVQAIFAADDPRIYSAYNQTFRAGQASTTAAPITIIDGTTPQITAADDMLIIIDSGFGMEWDQTVTTVTLSGSASGKVSTTVSYDDARTLAFDVTSDFSAGDMLIISGLKYTNFTGPTKSGANALRLYSGGGGSSEVVEFITNTAQTTWNVPGDWSGIGNTIEVIGGGGGGAAGASGGGGAYAKATDVSLSPGSTVAIKVGSGGAAATAGGDTYLCNSTSDCASIGGSAVQVGAKGGAGGVNFGAGGSGGSTASSVGDVKYAGGNGRDAWGHPSGEGGSGGGGAAGPNGAGGDGGRNPGVGSRSLYGAGGGGAGGGSAGNSDETNGNHNGGNNYLGSGGGAGGGFVAGGGAGTNGGGGGGGGFSGAGAGDGGAGTEWDATHGAGGGGGGGSENDGGDGGAGGLYGGGGGGRGAEGLQSAGTGAQGIIVITYTATDASLLAKSTDIITVSGQASRGLARISRPLNYLTADASLVGWWTFDGKNMAPNIRDSSGQANHGRLLFGASGNTATSTTPGKLGQALVFDGTDDYISVGDIAATEGVSQLSIALWARIDSTVSGGQLVTDTGAVGLDGFQLEADSSNLYWSLRNNADGYIGSTYSYAGKYNEWHHILVTYDGGQATNATKSKIYIDGVQQNFSSQSGTIPTSLSGNSEALMIGGCCSATPTQFMKGAMDDIRIYNRALSATEALLLYRSGATKVSSFSSSQQIGGSSLSAHWTFDSKNMTPTVRDSSGQGKHARLMLGGSGITATTTIFGKFNQALVFDGVDDYVSLPTSVIAVPVTYSAWFKTTASGVIMSDTNQPVEGSPSNYNPFMYVRSDGKLSVLIYDSSSIPVQGMLSTSTVNDGRWHHVVLTNNGSIQRGYLDGESMGSRANPLSQATDYLQIGTGYTNSWGSGNSSWYYFGGSIDDVRVYNSVLTHDQVQQLYRSGTAIIKP